MNSRAAPHHTAIAGVALALGVCGSMPSVAHAQFLNPRAYQIVAAGSSGLARGQALRYVWTNLADADTAQGAIGARHLSVRLLTSDGHVIAQNQAPAADPGKSQSFVFDRDLIPLPGEPGTGRLQVRLEATMTGNLTTLDVMPALLDTFDDSAEIVDTLSGRTLASFKPKEIVVVGTPQPLPIVGGNDSVWIDLGSAGVGFVPEQTLRVTVLNPFPPAPDGDGRSYKMLFAFIILDTAGRVVARRAEIELDPGEFQSFDFTSVDLPVASEPGTGRLQVRCEIERRFFHGIAARISQGKSVGVLELVQGTTGETVLLLPAVQSAREARQTPQP